MPCLASFFDAMSGVKKLTEVHAVSDYHTLACHPSYGINDDRYKKSAKTKSEVALMGLLEKKSPVFKILIHFL